MLEKYACAVNLIVRETLAFYMPTDGFVQTSGWLKISDVCHSASYVGNVTVNWHSEKLKTLGRTRTCKQLLLSCEFITENMCYSVHKELEVL